MTQQVNVIHEAVGVFDDVEVMQETVADLESSGFPRSHISVLGSEAAVKKQFGSSQLRTEDMEDNPDTPRAPDVKLEELSLGQGALISGGMILGVVAAIVLSGGMVETIGAITAVIIGGAIGTVLGALGAKLLGDKYAEFFQKQVEKGGMLLWVTLPERGMGATAQRILKKHGARDVHMHELPDNP